MSLQVRRRVSQACKSGPGLHGHALVLPSALTITIFVTLIFTRFSYFSQLCHTFSRVVLLSMFWIGALFRCLEWFTILPGELSTVHRSSSQELFFSNEGSQRFPVDENLLKNKMIEEDLLELIFSLYVFCFSISNYLFGGSWRRLVKVQGLRM